MRKIYNILSLLSLTLAMALTGCSNDDLTGMLTTSDESRVVSFSMESGMEEFVSSKASTYRSWTTGDPESLGVFGMYNMSYADMNMDKFFNNQHVTRSAGKWTYTPAKYWANFTSYQTFDFFGYMPYKDGATLTKDENEYTLSYDVELPNAVISDVANVPLICNAPVHKTVTGEVINYKMDQVLTGFCLKFMLGEDMSAIRDFVIKSVTIKGAATEIPYRGTVSRTYTYNPSDDTWTSGNVTWTNITKKAEATTFDLAFVDHDETGSIYDGTNSTLRIGYSDPGHSDVNMARQWGANFYTIPSDDFNPTIEVTYDVSVKDQNSENIITRQNVKSSILFGDSYFNYVSAGAVATVYPIVVQIIPNYLFVLADADQRLGYILVGE